VLPAALPGRGVSAYHRHSRDGTAKPLQFADVRRPQTEEKNGIQYAL